MKIRGTRYVAVAGLSAMLTFAGCRKPDPVNESVAAAQNAADNPAGLNLLQVPSNGTQVLGANYAADNTANGEDYGNDYNAMYADLDGTNDPYAEYVDDSVPYAMEPPPPIPDYEQPYAPGPDYIWTPGYWDYADTGYYWVPGAWVQPPYVGALWTPGWWGYYGNRYRYHHGYWGRNVGFYGGINFGFGYLGIGYAGGYWNNDHFYYNRAYNRVRPEVVHNYVYDRRANINNRFIDTRRVSYWGGPNGVRRAPVRSELIARAQRVTPPMRMQIENRQYARRQPQQFYRQNQGRPQMASARTGFQADRGIQRPQALQPAAIHREMQNMQQERTRWQQQHPQTQRGNGPQPNRPNEADRGRPGFVQPQNMPGRGFNPQQQNLTPQQRQTLERLHGRVPDNNHQPQQQRQQQAEQQRQQMQRDRANQQHQQQNVQRQQAEQQRAQQQRQQADQRRQQQQQNAQRQQQDNHRAEQARQQAAQRQEQQHQQQAQRAQQAQQRQEQQRQQAAQRAQQQQQRQAQQQQLARQQQQRAQQQQQRRQEQQPRQQAPQPHGGAEPNGHGNPHGGGPPQGGGNPHGGGHHGR